MTDAIPAPQARHPRAALRAIALFEALKGLAALAALLGVVDLMHRDVHRLAMDLIGRFGLDPQAHYPTLLLHYADLLPGADVRTALLVGAAYIALRWSEAFGLWHDRAWGEWLGALSGGLYLPFEISHLVHRPSLSGWLVLLANLALVAYLLWVLRKRRSRT